MSHYFTDDPSLEQDRKEIRYRIFGEEFVFTTNSGVFSKDHVDPASELLLQTLPRLTGTLLDLGCGYGAIGIILAKTYVVTLTQSDVTTNAVELTALNCAANGVRSEIIKSDCFENIPGKFDTITLNPPIHAGKSVTYRMFAESAAHLNHGGRLYVVTLKKHGAESTRAKLTELFGNCETLYKKQGTYVFCSTLP